VADPVSAARARRGRAALRLLVSGAVAAALIGVVLQSYRSGQMTRWYYHRAAAAGFAVDVTRFAAATPAAPVALAITAAPVADRPFAVRVQPGDRLPPGANGVITDAVLAAGRRAHRAGERLVVTRPFEIQTARGFRFKAGFRHQGIRPYPWAALWNLAVVLGLGLGCGLFAEALTDLLGLRVSARRAAGAK
jgi:hypothetical protein